MLEEILKRTTDYVAEYEQFTPTEISYRQSPSLGPYWELTANTTITPRILSVRPRRVRAHVVPVFENGTNTNATDSGCTV